ncbi:MAG: TerB family tellurite resistance protein [Campylobacterales bacterium]|nr:TerB family tellurite resistance protein [Campylobacterales bacterium]
MFNLILFGIVVYVLYRIFKSYQRFQQHYYTQAQFKNMRISKEAIAGSELGLFVALCAKVAKADGRIDALEAELIGNMFTDISRVFPEPQKVKEYLKEIFSEEKKQPRNVDRIVSELYILIHKDRQKCQMMMSFLINIAFIDGKVTHAEESLLTKIAAFLHFNSAEFESMMDQFRSSFSQTTVHSSIEQAYKLLGASASDDLNTIKKKYRTLVKKHHPDIIKAQGADEDYVRAATKKIQEINEAYETIKKQKA